LKNLSSSFSNGLQENVVPGSALLSSSGGLPPPKYPMKEESESLPLKVCILTELLLCLSHLVTFDSPLFELDF